MDDKDVRNPALKIFYSYTHLFSVFIYRECRKAYVLTSKYT